MDKELIKYYDFALEKKPCHPIDIESANYICNWINENFIFRMLEIGSGSGFSSNFFALNSNLKNIVSIEKKFGFYMICKRECLSEKITFIWEDFRKYKSDEKYPLIFLDASKTNQKNLFKKATKFLKEKGTIIIDNIFLNRLREKTDKNSLKIVSKIDQFKEFLLSLENFSVEIVNIGDGLAICQKKEK